MRAARTIRFIRRKFAVGALAREPARATGARSANRRIFSRSIPPLRRGGPTYLTGVSMRLSRYAVAALLAMTANSIAAQSPAKRGLRSSDLLALRTVGDPQISPEGEWIAYTVTSIDSAKD